MHGLTIEFQLWCLQAFTHLLVYLIQFAPFKPGSKRTLAGRARELGLEKIAVAALHNTQDVALLINSYVDTTKEGNCFKYSLR